MTKLDIAEQQLTHAIELFCSGERMISAITLAGAAEEILGKLVTATQRTNALDREVSDQCEMLESHFGRAADPKEFRALENDVRNELKHLCSGHDIELDLEQEAVNLIDRAIHNFRILRPAPNSAVLAFEEKAAVWWNMRANAFHPTPKQLDHQD